MFLPLIRVKKVKGIVGVYPNGRDSLPKTDVVKALLLFAPVVGPLYHINDIIIMDNVN